ncbi:hypothetical protein [Simkania sp.]|uniref:hypothetical protein n=1 Tax=Simkania sp. TaxID=34094 RepID=UPI003B51650D
MTADHRGSPPIPLPNPAAFKQSTPPESTSVGEVHIDTPFAFRSATRNGSHSSGDLEPSTPPNSGFLDERGTPTTSPMSDKTPSKVKDIGAFVHDTEEKKRPDGNESD